MDKLKLIFTFLKENISVKNTIAFIVAIFAMFIMIGIDACDTTNIKKIIGFYKDYFLK